MKRLSTALDVVTALGGPKIVCEITKANSKQAWHWHGRLGRFPAWSYVAMTNALKEKRKGYTAPPELWNQRGKGLKEVSKSKKKAA